MHYRRATPADLDGIAAFVIEGMQTERYPALVAPHKVTHLIRTIVFSSDHFHLCAFTDDGVLVGVVAALVIESLLCERCEAHVVACRGIAPCDGHVLLGALRDWRRNDMRIGRTVWPMEIGGDKRIERLARWYGFKHSTNMMIAFRGN
jgi:hypothetical protein